MTANTNDVENGSSSGQDTSTEIVTAKIHQPGIDTITIGDGVVSSPADETVKLDDVVSSSADETVKLDDVVSSSADETVKLDEVVSSSADETAKLDDVVSLIKEKDEVEEVMSFPKPVEGLHEMGTTPFLRKTFEIVDDAVTDPVVSWSPTRNSFIIWDSYKFSENLLPKYFKHKNFSSFIRQLNTKDASAIVKPVLGVETKAEIDSLKEDHSSLELEILNLKQQQEESHHQMISVQEKIDGVESKQLNILGFFTKLAKDERFAERLMKKRKEIEQQRELEETDEFAKKLKSIQGQESQENLPDVESELMSEELDATEPKLMNHEFMSDINTDEINLMSV